MSCDPVHFVLVPHFVIILIIILRHLDQQRPTDHRICLPNADVPLHFATYTVPDHTRKRINSTRRGANGERNQQHNRRKEEVML